MKLYYLKWYIIFSMCILGLSDKTNVSISVIFSFFFWISWICCYFVFLLRSNFFFFNKNLFPLSSNIKHLFIGDLICSDKAPKRDWWHCIRMRSFLYFFLYYKKIKYFFVSAFSALSAILLVDHQNYSSHTVTELLL